MKQIISNLQLLFLTANFIFSSSIINLPRILVQTTGQNAWLVPVLLLPLLFLIIFFLFRGNKKKHTLNQLFKSGSRREKFFLFFFLLFAAATFIRDLRGLIDFVASVLLPSTPVDVLMVLSILVIAYMAVSGLEVISRINMMHFVILTIIVVFLPFLLINKIHPGNMQPFLQNAPSILSAVYLSFAWVGEVFFFFIIISNVQRINKARRTILFGTAAGLFLFFIILFLEITVLGTKIVEEAAYPTYILIQQINFTDFFERVDLVIAAVWIPTLMTKISYLLYAINYCISYFYKSNTNKFLFPVSLIIGLISILLFKNTMDYIQFSFYTWSSLGLTLELIIIILFLFVKKKSAKEGNIKKGEKPIG